MSLTARWIMSVEIVLYQEATAFRMCNEGVILALVPLLFWGEFIRVQKFFSHQLRAPAVISLFWFWKKTWIHVFDMALWKRRPFHTDKPPFEHFSLCSRLSSGWCLFAEATEAGPESEVRRAKQESSKTAGSSSRHAGLRFRQQDG